MILSFLSNIIMSIPRPIAIIICLILILFLGIGLVVSNYQKLSLFKLRVREKTVELQSEKDYFSKIDTFSKKLKENEESLAKINSSLTIGPEISNLCYFFQKAVSRSGLVLKKISPGTTNNIEEKLIKEGWSEELQQTETNLTVAGSYNSFKNFLSTLEKTARMIEIENISFSIIPVKEGEIESPIDFNLKIKTYSY